MRFNTLVALATAAAVLAGPSSLAAPRLQPPQSDEDRPPTRCEAKAIEIVERATEFSERASQTSIPFEKTDKATRSCGVLLQGVDTLREMGCPQELIDLMAQSQREAQETVNQLNDRYDFHFHCDTPEYRRASLPNPGFRLRG